jgi:hypothetical protein
VIRLFTLVAAGLAVATLIGLIVLWPGDVESQVAQGIAVESEKATVQMVEEGLCTGLSGQQCQLATARIESGPEKGKRIQIQLDAGGFDPDVDPGDKTRVGGGGGHRVHAPGLRAPRPDADPRGTVRAGGARLRSLARRAVARRPRHQPWDRAAVRGSGDSGR